MRTSVGSVVTVPFLLATLSACRASEGDRSWDFRLCVRGCVSRDCSRSAALPLALSLLRWSCQENCEYNCMHEVTAEDVALNRPVRQFRGKWPFVRLLGVQEPASVLFSLLNAAAVAGGYWHFSTHTPPTNPLHWPLQAQLLVWLNTWLWSCVFHARDTYWTEKLDYFSAALLIVVGLVVQFIRITGRRARRWHWIYGGVWLGLYTLHVSYLSLFKFEYGYNMAASVTAGAVSAVLWTVWSIREWTRRKYAWKCVVSVVAASVTLLLELLDFPPLWWVVDAHALWHLSTVPIPLLWYSFLTDDANYEFARSGKRV